LRASTPASLAMAQAAANRMSRPSAVMGWDFPPDQKARLFVIKRSSHFATKTGELLETF
jgi:hypothetical protein